jgi:hypothetical protein
MGQATPQLLHFYSRPESPYYLVEEIAYPTLEEAFRIHATKSYRTTSKPFDLSSSIDGASAKTWDGMGETIEYCGVT